jgi:N-acetylglutamate synthase-like GNAT family acetyltransferase
VIVRDFEPADEPACRALFAELVEVHRALYPDGNVGGEFQLEEWMLVAEEDGRVVGYVGLRRHPKSVELEPVIVGQDNRGCGAGRALVERAVEEARAAGVTRVYASPVGRNRDAIAFFHSVGLDTLGYVHVQLDLEPRERRPAERIAGREFRV